MSKQTPKINVTVRKLCRVKQDANRKTRVRGLMEYSFNVCHSFGDVWMSDDDQACALVLYPDQRRTTLNAISWDASLALSVIGLGRIGVGARIENQIVSSKGTFQLSVVYRLCKLNLYDAKMQKQFQGIEKKEKQDSDKSQEKKESVKKDVDEEGEAKKEKRIKKGKGVGV